jgi:hypothetical protein
MRFIYNASHGDIGKGIEKARHKKKCSHKSRGDAQHLGVKNHQKDARKRKHEIVSQVADEISYFIPYVKGTGVFCALIHAKKLLSVFEPYMSMISFLNVPETKRIMRFFLLIFCGKTV